MNYDPTKQMTREEALANPQPVCVLIDADGNPQGVLVQTFDDKFIIDLKDFNEGKKKGWHEAMTALKAEGKTTFTQQQAYLILYLRTSITIAILSVEGKDFEGQYWTTTEYGKDIFWHVCFGRALFGVSWNYACYVVRAVTEFA